MWFLSSAQSTQKKEKRKHRHPTLESLQMHMFFSVVFTSTVFQLTEHFNIISYVNTVNAFQSLFFWFSMVIWRQQIGAVYLKPQFQWIHIFFNYSVVIFLLIDWLTGLNDWAKKNTPVLFLLRPCKFHIHLWRK